MTAMPAWWKAAADGGTIRVRVQPRAGSDAVVGPMPDGSLPLGDIVLAFETVEREAGEAGISLADHATHMVVHGTLHLLQYDHETDADAEVMESHETAILAGLGIADPYARETM